LKANSTADSLIIEVFNVDDVDFTEALEAFQDGKATIPTPKQNQELSPTPDELKLTLPTPQAEIVFMTILRAECDLEREKRWVGVKFRRVIQGFYQSVEEFFEGCHKRYCGLIGGGQA
jgi:hypothetical protein